MRKFTVVCLLVGSALLQTSTLNAAPVHDWSSCFGGPANNTAFDVAIDESGNVVIVGTFFGSMVLGGQTITSVGGSDIFVAKFDANGFHVWSKRFGGTGNDAGRGVTVDGAGNIVMTGSFRGPVGFGGTVLTGRGLLDVFVAKYDATGSHVWSQWYGSTANDEGQELVADALDNVIVTGHYGGVINFGGGPDTPAFGGNDMFVLKLDAAGAHQWSKGLGSAGADAGFGIALGASNSAVLTGQFSNTVNFGGSPLTSAGATDAFVVAYAADGSHQWSTRHGVATADAGQGVTTDAAGNVAVTGTANGTFVNKYDTNGAQLWSQTFRSNVTVQGMDIVAGPAGAITVTGGLRGTVDFGGGPLTSAGDDDIFVAMFDAAGAHEWSRQFGNTGDDWGFGCAFDAAGDLMVTGIFSVSVDFGGGPLVSAGLNDVYMVKFAEEDIVDTTPPAITCPADVQVEQPAPNGTPATHPIIAAFLAGASALDNMDPAPDITHDAPAVFPLGVTVVTFRATDAAGNSAECSAMVTGVDTTPPQITCPAGVQVEQADPSGTPATHAVIATFLSGASASDAVDPAPAITHDAPAVFPAGVTNVTFRATDASGNHSLCTAMVTVVDTTPPQITCPAGVQVERTTPEGAPATHPAIAAFLAGAVAADGADPAPVVTHNAPEFFPLGTTMVTFSARDASGNHAACTASVSVLETAPPEIEVVLDKDVLWPPDHSFVTVCAEVTVSENGNGFLLVSITSNEPEDKVGSGQTSPDVRGAEFGTPDLCFDLRAERAGNGDDRVYEIVYATSDDFGNTAYATVHVTVPHDKSAELTSVHPNPFNPQTTLVYALSVGDRVQLAIYDARGSLVRRLVDQTMPAGEHRVTWNGLDQHGMPVSSGIYFVKLAAGSAVDSRKMVLLK